jgi:hypothetical protein
MTTELVLLGTAGALLPVVGRAGICSALVVGERVFVRHSSADVVERSTLSRCFNGT